MNSMLQGLFADAIFAKDLFKFCKMVEELGVNLDEEIPLSLYVLNSCLLTVSVVEDLLANCFDCSNSLFSSLLLIFSSKKKSRALIARSFDLKSSE